MAWLELDIKTFWEKYNLGELTSLQVTSWYLKRIANLDNEYKSIIEINPDALFLAEAMDRELKQGEKRSILHGIPILLKDNISTNDSLHTSAGSLALKDNFARRDAYIVEKLRKAGAIILGKTNMTEMSHYTSNRMAAGYSARGGQTVNPYKRRLTPSGSSSGSAVAMALNFALLSIGTETKGSIIWPSYNNSVVGLKPSRGLISRSGLVPISRTYDTAGPIARTVADCAHLLSIIAGEDQDDPSTWAYDRWDLNYGDYLDVEGMKGMRLGIYRRKTDKEGRHLFEEAKLLMEALGAEFTDIYNLPSILDKDLALLSHEFKRSLEAYLKDYGSSIGLLEEIIRYNKKETSLKYGQDLLEEAMALGDTLKDKDYLELRTSFPYEIRRAIEEIMDKERLDLIVYPGRSDLAAVSGLPSIIVPAGYMADKAPFGISFMARFFDEGTLIRGAYTYEQASMKRKPPLVKGG